jgi:hypothetical protein
MTSQMTYLKTFWTTLVSAIFRQFGSCFEPFNIARKTQYMYIVIKYKMNAHSLLNRLVSKACANKLYNVWILYIYNAGLSVYWYNIAFKCNFLEILNLKTQCFFSHKYLKIVLTDPSEIFENSDPCHTIMKIQ